MSVLESLLAVNVRLDKVQHRLDRIENGLNTLLEIFGQPTLEQQERGKQAPLASLCHNAVNHGATPAPMENTSNGLDPALLFNQSEEGQSLAVATKGGQSIYTPLDTSKSQIRVLALYPSEDNPVAPIVASLHVQSLDEEVYIATPTFRQYIALSYTWGPQASTSTIQIDGHEFPVTISLEAALQAMRKRDKHRSFGPAVQWPHNTKSPTYWWIDQICINQADIDERNQQVALMRRIFKRANSVHVWLGEEEDDSSLAMDLINTLGATPARAPGEKTIDYPKFGVEQVDKHWRALYALFKRPWWSRVWIRQEVALSSRGHAWYVPSFLKVNQAAEGSMEAGLPWTHNATSLLALREATNGGYTFVPLTYLLPPSRACKATDPRDTVFSTLGMCDHELFDVTADYRMNLRDVLMSATWAVIAKANGLDILSACQNPWKALPFATSNGGIRGSSRLRELDVTDGDMAIVQIDGDCLILHGGHVDSVALLCEDIVPTNATSEALDSIFSKWKDFVTMSAISKQLDERDVYDFTDEESLDVDMNWVRFLTVLSDEARDLKGGYTFSAKERAQLTKQRNANLLKAGAEEILCIAEEELRRTNSYYHINLKTARAYLLPSTPEPFPLRLHPNRRAHAGLKRNGPGRRLCITKRGFLAMIPDEAKVEDRITIFRGATFPYVLRKDGGKKRYTLVGEVFVPRYASGKGEEMARHEFRVSLDAKIRIC
ncbi:uncharacterized protein PV09_00304 [Verruconis gallopava]|uniref:Heterokaryon incompatibility domain-containing protein n=1 Tax=Verruconis gallopava TaxID=253628 RepID=A0A0D2BDA3_9PEZI|nr:uncharacterized protein PV09_00304 [Verruconis gallopava]KIW09414.1 hypothetical protein PV09_00304 [Verruconis gallopava]